MIRAPSASPSPPELKANGPQVSAERWFWVLLGVVVLGGWVARVSPFFRFDGVLGWPMDYDEGVYVTASALLWRGHLPYRDFTFVHPPGLLLLLGPLTGFGDDFAAMFRAARVGMTVVGALNVALVGVLVRRHAGAFGALLGATLYAVFPTAVGVERGVFLEPLLNCFCLAFLACWTGNSAARRWAGALAGLALATKSWGVLWLLGALAARRGFWASLRLVLSAAAVALILVGPFLVLSGWASVDQLLRFHLWRPPDGDVQHLPRLVMMFANGNWVPTLVIVGSATSLLRQRHLPIVRASGAVLVLVTAANLAAAAWWSQYNAHLASVLCLVAGLGGGFAWNRWRPGAPAWRQVLAAGLWVAAAFPGAQGVVLQRHLRAPEQSACVARLRSLPAGRAPCAFESFHLLASGRLQSSGGPGPVMVDPYGQQLLEAVRGGARCSHVAEAFQSEASQLQLRAQLEHCDLVVLSGRGDWQMNGATRSWFEAAFAPVGDTIYLARPEPTAR